MRVVNCRTSHCTVYIGRPSILGNPASHIPSKYSTIRARSREEAINYFRDYARGNESVMKAIRGLKESDVLGCWCKPLECHGDVIVEMWKDMQKEITMGKKVETENEQKQEKQEEKQKVVVNQLPLISVLDSKPMKRAKSLLAECAELKSKIEIYQERYDEILEELGGIQTEAGLPGLRWGKQAFYQQVVKGRETLDKMLLVANGVSAEQIQKSMKTGKPSVRKVFVPEVTT